MKKRLFLFATLLIVMAGCQKNEFETSRENNGYNPMDSYIRLKGGTIGQTIDAAYLDKVNAMLLAEGVNYRVAMAELIVAYGSNGNGHTVYSKVVGNKQLPAHFVAGDPRRQWSAGNGTEITFAIDQTEDIVPPFGIAGGAEATTAIMNAFNTWDAVKSTNLGLTRNDDEGLDIGIMAYLNGSGGSPYVFADIQMAGFRDLTFGEGVLGVTITFVWIDGDDVPTDIDGNNKADVAFREIYFDPYWYWGVNYETNAIDIHSIALHEIGHGLSQAHFGTVFVDQKGNVKASPRAVMNAFYLWPLRTLQQSDIGGHSSIWGTWPY
jgi:hypothetical protein